MGATGGMPPPAKRTWNTPVILNTTKTNRHPTQTLQREIWRKPYATRCSILSLSPPSIMIDSKLLKSGAKFEYKAVSIARAQYISDDMTFDNVKLHLGADVTNVAVKDDEFVIADVNHVTYRSKRLFIAQVCAVSPDFATYVDALGGCPAKMIPILFKDSVADFTATYYKEGDTIPARVEGAEATEAKHNMFSWEITKIQFNAKVQKMLDEFIDRVLERQIDKMFD